ncbi:SIS domain-containing protein [Mannheimia sp. AT1]|uniref:SIS domain-containing protein n=1 Tax=Mannheimia cairinae TaxID=3025936 RepID=A0ABT5MM94_9PAST|nr:SIS domain-containing protein [Mannheimia cairinae]MDD0823220.1 SIS domain-containing protein [Mannheimia cairinae]MDD0825754.1 SIS domain-containing protein [Mannheimia cairinae]
MLNKIQDRFTESIQTQILAAELLPNKLSEAANRIVACLLRGNKVIVCGHGHSYGNAELLVSHLLHRYELARPSFSAVQLQLNGVLAGVLTLDNELESIYRKQLQAVAKAGDLFIVFSPAGNEESVLQAIHTAKNQELDLDIIAFTGSRNDHTLGVLDESDIEVSAPSTNDSRVVESHHFYVNLLCELIDHLLFS